MSLVELGKEVAMVMRKIPEGKKFFGQAPHTKYQCPTSTELVDQGNS